MNNEPKCPECGKEFIRLTMNDGCPTYVHQEMRDEEMGSIGRTITTITKFCQLPRGIEPNRRKLGKAGAI